MVALAQRLRDQIIMPPGRAETFNHGRDGSLLRREEVRVTAQVLCSDAVGEVTLNSGDGATGVEPSVVHTVGDDDRVGREPVTANVGALPHQFRPSLTERTPHRPAPHCAAGVMLPMSADQDDRRKAGIPGRCQS